MYLDAESIKSSLTEEQIIALLEKLGSETYQKDINGNLIFRTVCHNAKGQGSFKLYYYSDTLLFKCYTSCSGMDLFELVQKAQECSFAESVRFICTTLGLRREYREGFTQEKELTEDWDLIEKYKIMKPDEKQENTFTLYRSEVLDLYEKALHIDWAKDNILPNVIEKFNIRFDVGHNRIIIPHYNITDQLIGIRVRNLNQKDVDLGHKYMPLILERQMYNHPLGYSLYGLNKNIESIKKCGKIVLFESEKSVLQCESYYGDNNFTVATCGNNISNVQRDIILQLGVKEVFIAFDKEFETAFTPKSDKYAEHIMALANKFSPYVRTYVLWDTVSALDYKDSPSDKGKEVLEILMKNKFEVNTMEGK